MKKYKILFKASVEKDLRAIPKRDVIVIKNKIENELSYDPLRKSVALKGQFKGFYKYRIGKYRVIFKLSKEEVLILIVKIGHRKDVYR